MQKLRYEVAAPERQRRIGQACDSLAISALTRIASARLAVPHRHRASRMVYEGAFTVWRNARMWNGHDSEYIGIVGRYTDSTLQNIREFTHRLQARFPRKTAQASAAQSGNSGEEGGCVGALGFTDVNEVCIQGIALIATRNHEGPESGPPVRLPSRRPTPIAEPNSAGDVSRSWMLWPSIVPCFRTDRWRASRHRSASLMRAASGTEGGALRVMMTSPCRVPGSARWRETADEGVGVGSPSQAARPAADWRPTPAVAPRWDS